MLKNKQSKAKVLEKKTKKEKQIKNKKIWAGTLFMLLTGFYYNSNG